MNTRRGGRKKTSMVYGDKFLIDMIIQIEIGAELFGINELIPDQEWQIIKDDESFWQEDHSLPELEMTLDQSMTERREHHTSVGTPRYLQVKKRSNQTKSQFVGNKTDLGKRLRVRLDGNRATPQDTLE